MKITIDAILFKDCMKAIGTLVDEVTLKVTEVEMSIISMDPANVAMIAFNLPSSSAIEWEVETTEKEPAEKIMVRLADLNKVLKRVIKDDILKIETTENRLVLKISGYKEFVMPLLADDDSKEQKLPTLDHKAKITLPLKRLADAIEDCAIADEAVNFVAETDKFVLDSESTLTKAAITLTGEDVKIEAPEKQRARFALEYLNKMLPKVSDLVEIGLGTDYPLSLFYKAQHFKLMFILAPRVESA